MNTKYELIKTDTKQVAGHTLYRIRALVAIGSLVASGELGGYIEREVNLSVYGNAWVSDNARVYDNALVSGDAQVFGNALVYGNAWVELRSHIQWYSCVGSDNGTLTAYQTKDGIELTRGCFRGDLKTFRVAVRNKHGETSKIGAQYLGLANIIAHWFDQEIESYAAPSSPAEGRIHEQH
jgi:hypothetical protein